MLEFLTSLKSSLRWIDVVDIGFVAFILYRVLLLIKGTRAMQMLTGLGVLAVAFFLSSSFKLFTTHWLLSHLFDYLVLMIIVVFQDDLRRALTQVGKNPFFASSRNQEELAMIDEVSRAAIQLATVRCGALIVFERETGLKNLIETGSPIYGDVRAELLHSIFLPNSPMHDGAVILSGGRLAAAGCFLPLSKDPNIDKRYGTRHRAAIGVTEDTDAVVVLVSEEAGEAHLVQNGRMVTNLSETELTQSLRALLDLGGTGNPNLPQRVRSFLTWMKVYRSEEK